MAIHPRISLRGTVRAISDRVANIPYEDQLDQDAAWALSEASLFFAGQGFVQEALRKVTGRLAELGIPYTVVGGLALFQHGYRRFTEDVDLLVRKQDLQLIHQKLEGHGFRPPFPHSKNLRDGESGVSVKFLIAGEFPGDGKPKPVAFPDPTASSRPVDGIHYLNLGALIEMKLASGMTAAGRAKDLGDVTELIKTLKIPLGFGDTLHPFVRDRFREIWHDAQCRFVRLWQVEPGSAPIASIDDLIAHFPASAPSAGELKAMKADGITVDPTHASPNRPVHLLTTNPALAEKYGMVDESELWPDT